MNSGHEFKPTLNGPVWASFPTISFEVVVEGLITIHQTIQAPDCLLTNFVLLRGKFHEVLQYNARKEGHNHELSREYTIMPLVSTLTSEKNRNSETTTQITNQSKRYIMTKKSVTINVSRKCQTYSGHKLPNLCRGTEQEELLDTHKSQILQNTKKIGTPNG